MITSALDVLFVALGVPALGCSLYLAVLTLLSAKLPLPPARTPTTRFRVLIPAHNESAGIVATIESLSALEYPKDRYEVLVIADNCVDDTATLARSAGAQVLERHSETERGKGYALHYAFERLPPEVDAVVVIDADTLVSPNILVAFDKRLSSGADAAQADYAVRNPNASWRTRLVAVAFGAFHIVRSRGRERLSVSAGLRGNGMCFSSKVLREVPHEAFSIVEDVEYGIRLAERGHRVFYADEAHVYGEMVSNAKAASSQRERWEGGRAALTRKYGPRLLRAGLAGNRVLLDLAIDVFVPPLSRIAVMAGLGFVVSLSLSYVLGGFALSRAVYGFSVAAIAAYVLRGWMLSGTGARGLLDLALAPVYVVWKATLSKRRAPDDAEWVRTTREKAPSDAARKL